MVVLQPPAAPVEILKPLESPVVSATEAVVPKKFAKNSETKKTVLRLPAPSQTPDSAGVVTPVPATIAEVPATPAPPPPQPNRSPVVASPGTVREPAPDYNSARLLITSPSVPETLTIVVTVDNELLFRRDPPAAPANPPRGSNAFVELSGLRTAPMSEERPLAPGKHKVQVHILMAAQRIARVQEVTERFYSGQRRVLQIELPPDFQRLAVASRDDARFNISIR
jgi:hypothetical protein